MTPNKIFASLVACHQIITRWMPETCNAIPKWFGTVVLLWWAVYATITLICNLLDKGLETNTEPKP